MPRSTGGRAHRPRARSTSASARRRDERTRAGTSSTIRTCPGSSTSAILPDRWIARRSTSTRRRSRTGSSTAAGPGRPPSTASSRACRQACGPTSAAARVGTAATWARRSSRSTPRPRWPRGCARSRPLRGRVVADLEHLPFRAGALTGAWAQKSYMHIAADRLPLALAELQRALAVGGAFHLQVTSDRHHATGRRQVRGPALLGVEPRTAHRRRRRRRLRDPRSGRRRRGMDRRRGDARPHAARHRRTGHARPRRRPEPERALGRHRHRVRAAGQPLLARRARGRGS